MPNRQYNKGVRYERKLKHQLEERGYTVTRGAGSHGYDLIASTDALVYFISCKTTMPSKPAIRNYFDKHKHLVPLCCGRLVISIPAGQKNLWLMYNAKDNIYYERIF